MRYYIKINIIFNISLLLLFPSCKKEASNQKILNHDQQMHFVKNEINTINSLKLKKYVFITENFKKWQLINRDRLHNLTQHEISKNPFFANIYIDTENKIRKFIQISNFPEGSKRLIEYFTSNGDMCYLLFHVNNNSSYYFVGNILYYNSNPIKIDTIKYGNQHGNLSKPDEKILRNIYPSQKEIDYHLNINILKIEFDISSSNFAKIRPHSHVIFTSPKNNDESYINSNYVNIRKKPTINSKSIDQINVFNWIQIISTNNFDIIPNCGKANWHEVIYYYNHIIKKRGYLFGCFIEPVEKISK